MENIQERLWEELGQKIKSRKVDDDRWEREKKHSTVHGRHVGPKKDIFFYKEEEE